MNHPAFKFIKAVNFFPAYAPGVKNWKHKLRGADGNKKPITFTKQDMKAIAEGLEMFAVDFC